jgi:hypothetical protein
MRMSRIRLIIAMAATMVTMAALAAPANAQGVDDQIQQIYKGGVIRCNTQVADGFIAQEDFDQCVEEHYLTNLASLLQGLEGTGRLTDEASGVLNGLLTTSEQLT